MMMLVKGASGTVHLKELPCGGHSVTDEEKWDGSPAEVTCPGCRHRIVKAATPRPRKEPTDRRRG